MSEEMPPFEPDADFFSNPESFIEPEPLESFPPIEEESFVPPPPVHTPPPAAEAPAPAASPRPAAKPAKAPAEYKPKVIPGAFAMLVLGGAVIGAGIGIGKTLPEPPAAPPAAAPAAPAAGSETAAAPAPTPTAPLSASADDHKALAGKVDELTKTLAAIQAKIDGMPKPTPPIDIKPIETKLTALDAKVGALAAKPAPTGMADLKPIEEKVADLTKAVGGMSSVPTQLAALKDQVAAQDKTIAALKAAASDKPTTEKTASAEKPTTERSNPAMPATPASSTPAADIEGALAQAATLFSQNQFGPARDAFVKLQATAPTDARVWYYAAMSNGFATNQWEAGDTQTFVQKAVALEKAGTPAKAKIDAAFAGLNANAKGWLDAYRATAR